MTAKTTKNPNPQPKRTQPKSPGPAKTTTEARPAAAAADDLLAPELQAEYVRQLRLAHAEIPQRYREKTLENFATGKSKRLMDVVDYARMYSDTFQLNVKQKGLFIFGCTGCGKSHIASAILKLVIGKEHTGYWCNVAELMNVVRDVMARSIPYENLETVEARCVEAGLLVLDDLGAESPKGLALQRLYSLVNARYERNRPIVVTSNLEIGELARQFDDKGRIMSRLSELCTKFAPFPNADYRLKHMK